MTDTSPGAFFLHPAWHSLVKRLAVAAGTLAALVSLAQHTPIWVASFRGALAFLAVRLVAGWGLTALTVALKADQSRKQAEQHEEV